MRPGIYTPAPVFEKIQNQGIIKTIVTNVVVDATEQHREL
jgi:hypothetical protein